ncbi:MAG: elongation factor Ts [Candidatus Kerfeldbacteria bacterium CG08_land_8_20_14_0_20_40_16]|uniref:Elongation factor Ts n=1 Tax=Candidatus Kerfeldbacteria bacterium CG08_land_8_20_14_0_20_40_16 TaxID=2014244 RepID=A0A2H0YXF9_9BACT|nr:MAG: elongation factor Ts [Candidatus Kerfeldbacteria bacterium CG08_land_8_20_14_0_20_40_16]
MPKTSMDQIRELRQKTGAGVMDAKEVLEETKGDIEKAIELLRKKGQKISVEKQSREAKEGWIGHYVHTNGKVAALVELYCETDFVARNAEFKELAHNIAMQIVALNPSYLSPQDVPEKEKEKEREIYREQIKNEKKSQNIIDKIVEGKLSKFYSEICLLKQPYFQDEKITVEDLVTEKISKLGEKIEIGKFVRLNL